MNLAPPATALVAALTLSACQPQKVAEAPVDPAITAVVAEAHDASFDDRGKARDPARGFSVEPVAAPAVAMPSTMNQADQPIRPLSAPPTESVGGETAF